MKKHYREENDCLNCGTELQGKFCHVCGQENLQVKENFGHLMNHAISDYFHFDHQFFHTLKPLLFKPGKLTTEYMAGRRVQYLHPIKMYIFISVVYFLLFFKSGHDVVKVNDGRKPAQTAQILDSINNAIAHDPSISQERKKLIADKIKRYGAVTIDKDGNLKVNKAGDVDTVDWKPGGKNKPKIYTTSKDTSFEQYLASQGKLKPDKQDGILEKIYNKIAFSYQKKYGERAMDVFVEEFQHNVPKMMFLMLPLFAVILRFTFWKSKKFYVEHLIYSFHLHCYLFLTMGSVILLEMIIPHSWGLSNWLDGLASLYIIWYIYKSLRVVYHRGWFRTISKMIGMSIAYWCFFVICISLVLILTAISGA